MICSSALKKNGKTSAGKTRYRCSGCGASTTPTRSASTRRHQLEAFVERLLGHATVSDLDIAKSTFHRRHAWCWNVEPLPPAPSGEVHEQIFLDGTYFNGYCVLIASTADHVISWQFCDREKTASWTALISKIPAPTYAIVDGNGPLNTVIKTYWPDTQVQRCLFHVRHDIHRHLTRAPTLVPNKELLALVKTISNVSSPEEAANWVSEFAAWETTYKGFLKHRTHAQPGVQRPSSVSPQQKWWYTHPRTRRAHKLLTKLLKDKHLFTWIQASLDGHTIARATSLLEGGFNNPIKALLRNHRGMNPEHAKTAVAWWLHAHTNHPAPMATFIQDHHWNPQPQPQPTTSEPKQIGPAAYDRAFSPEDGNGIQHGWAGRSHQLRSTDTLFGT